MFGKKLGPVIVAGLVAISCGTDPSITEPEAPLQRDLRPAAILTVTNTADGDPAPIGSFRWALEQANATPDFDEIVFAIDPTDPSNDCTPEYCRIITTAILPHVTGRLTISGPPQAADFDPPQIVIEEAIVVGGPDCTFRWLTVTKGLNFLSHGLGDVVVENNFIGTNPAGDIADPSVTVALNLIYTGTSARIEGNVIGAGYADYVREGIRVYNIPGVEILNNRIGVDRTGEFLLAGPDGSALHQAINIADAGSHRIEGNILAAQGQIIVLGGLGGNVVQGNRLGVGISGASVFPPPPHLPYGIDVRSDDNIIGLAPSGSGEPNIFGGPGFGVVIGAGSHLISDGTSVIGNLFGVDAHGDPLPPADRRVAIITGSDSEDIAIGLPGLGNRFCCYNEGIRLSAFPTNVRVLGNHFESMISSAIFVLGSTAPIQIGDVEPGAGNTIMSNGLSTASPGIKLLGTAQGVTIRGNIIHDNGGLGIDLLNIGTNQYSFPDGPTPNDPGDPDDGGNGLQNYPVLTQATTGGGIVTVHGSLNSHPNSTFRLEFFSNAVEDPSGHGEGENPVGTVDVTTDAQGDAEFLAILPADVPLGHSASATATGPDGTTSEFSAVATFVAVTAEESVQDVLDAVEDLIAGGDLAQGFSSGLAALLTQAIAQIASGNDATAIQQLQVFVQLVGQFIGNGKLDPVEGQALIDLATVAIQRLGG